MKLSADQAHLAYIYLQTKGRPPVDSPLTSRASTLSPELIERAIERMASDPDLAPDSVPEPWSTPDGAMPSAEAVAERILWRTIADSLR